MLYTLNFSHIQDGVRKPLLIDGREAALEVEAVTRTDAIYHKDTKAFSEANGDCTVSRVIDEVKKVDHIE